MLSTDVTDFFLLTRREINDGFPLAVIFDHIVDDPFKSSSNASWGTSVIVPVFDWNHPGIFRDPIRYSNCR
jgi:hypothetical protein